MKSGAPGHENARFDAGPSVTPGTRPRVCDPGTGITVESPTTLLSIQPLAKHEMSVKIVHELSETPLNHIDWMAHFTHEIPTQDNQKNTL
jgi:hypothetical protein